MSKKNALHMQCNPYSFLRFLSLFFVKQVKGSFLGRHTFHINMFISSASTDLAVNSVLELKKKQSLAFL